MLCRNAMSTSSCPCLRIVVPRFVFAVICVCYVHTLLTALFSQPLSHFVCYYRTLKSHIMFACLSLKAFSHAMFAHWRQHCFFSDATVPLCLRMLFSHANFVHFLRTICLQEIIEQYSRMLLSYATFARHFSHVTFSCYFRTLCSHARSHIVFQTLLSQAQCARYLGTLGSHTTFARYPSFANTFPTLGLEPLPQPLTASGGTGRRPLQYQ